MTAIENTDTDTDNDLYTAYNLITAIWHKDRAAVQEIIAQGFNVNKCYYRRVPLVEAVEEQKNYKDPAQGELIIQDLIKAGADPNTIYPERGRSYDRKVPALYHIVRNNCSLGLVKVFLEAGADPNFLDDSGGGHAACKSQKTPFMVAGGWGDMTLLQLMLDFGADLNIRNRAGAGIWHCVPPTVENYKFLARAGADINMPLNSRNETLLMNLVTQPENERLVECLLQHGAAPNQQCADGETALHKAVRKDGNLTNVELLFKFNAEPNITEWDYNRTPIFMACKCNNWEIVKCLLNHGANPKIKDESGRDCKDLEILSEKEQGKNLRTIREFLARGEAERES